MSEFSTPVSSEQDSEEAGYVPPKPTRWGKKPVESEYKFLDSILEASNYNEINQRLLQIYERQDLWRTRKWVLSNPERAEM